MQTFTPPTPATRSAPPPEPPTVRARRRLRWTDSMTAAVFLAPGVVAFLVFVLGPVVGGLALSFFRWDLFSTPEFVGMENIRRLLLDPDVWQSLWVSVMFVVLGVVPTTVIGFVLAVAVNTRMRAISTLRVMYLSPILASSAVSAVIWVNIFNPRSGVLNQALGWIGVDGPSWLNDLVWARPALVVIMIWSSLPLVILIYIAGLQRISDDLYAAAAIDGAGKWRQLWNITWPGVRSTTGVVLVLMFVAFLSGSFEIALILTNGGPLGQTTSLALYAYKQAFDRLDTGYASALSLFQLLVLVAVALAGRAVRAFWRARA